MLPFGGSAAAELTNEAASVGVLKRGDRLPPKNFDRKGLRRCDRDAARTRADAVTAAWQSRLAEARRSAKRLLVQGPRRLQQDGALERRGARPRRDRSVGRQPCARRRAGRAQAR